MSSRARITLLLYTCFGHADKLTTENNKTMDKNKVLNEFDDLPQDAQKQVMDFIAFLQSRYKTEASRKKAKRKDISKEPFIGIWKTREDMSDSSAWVRNARNREWGNTA